MKRTMQILLTGIVILLGSASALAQNTASTRAIQEKERAALFPPASMIELGRTVASSKCADCHGIDGMSTGEGLPNLAGQRTIYLYRVLQNYQNDSRNDNSMTHVSRFLNDEAMLSVATYYASLTPRRNPGVADAIKETEPLDANPFTGILTTIKKCTKCHGETGNSTASGMPSLTAQAPGYFITSMQAYVDGSRKHKLMKKLVSKLDEQTIKEMGVFYAVQQPLPTETVGDGDTESGGEVAEKCATCHGVDGNANADDMPTLAGQDARYFIKAMQAYKEGARKQQSMFEAVDGLSESDINDLATFYAKQEPMRREVRTPFTTTEWIERCERCHGINGNSTDPRFPMLAGQNEDYLKKVMQAYSSGARPMSVMHAMSEPLTETDIQLIAAHYAAQEPKSVIYMQLPCEDQTEN